MDTQGNQSKTHPMMPVPRKGSAIKVPSGGSGSSPEDSGPDKSVHGVPGGGRKRDTAYAVPKRSMPSPTARENTDNASQKANAWPAVGNPTPGSAPGVNQQPRVPFQALDVMPRNKGGQDFPYGSGVKQGFGFDRLKQGM